jgi:hypothetical protein
MLTYSAFSLHPLHLCGSIALGFAFSAVYSRISAKSALPIVRRRHPPSHSLHLCHFSGINRASRHSKMQIRRIAPPLPPVMSAENMQIMQKMQILLSTNTAFDFAPKQQVY